MNKKETLIYKIPHRRGKLNHMILNRTFKKVGIEPHLKIFNNIFPVISYNF